MTEEEIHKYIIGRIDWKKSPLSVCITCEEELKNVIEKIIFQSIKNTIAVLKITNEPVIDELVFMPYFLHSIVKYCFYLETLYLIKLKKIDKIKKKSVLENEAELQKSQEKKAFYGAMLFIFSELLKNPIFKNAKESLGKFVFPPFFFAHDTDKNLPESFAFFSEFGEPAVISLGKIYLLKSAQHQLRRQPMNLKEKIYFFHVFFQYYFFMQNENSLMPSIMIPMKFDELKNSLKLFESPYIFDLYFTISTARSNYANDIIYEILRSCFAGEDLVDVSKKKEILNNTYALFMLCEAGIINNPKAYAQYEKLYPINKRVLLILKLILPTDAFLERMLNSDEEKKIFPFPVNKKDVALFELIRELKKEKNVLRKADSLLKQNVLGRGKCTPKMPFFDSSNSTQASSNFRKSSFSFGEKARCDQKIMSNVSKTEELHLKEPLISKTIKNKVALIDVSIKKDLAEPSKNIEMPKLKYPPNYHQAFVSLEEKSKCDEKIMSNTSKTEESHTKFTTFDIAALMMLNDHGGLRPVLNSINKYTINKEFLTDLVRLINFDYLSTEVKNMLTKFLLLAAILQKDLKLLNTIYSGHAVELCVWINEEKSLFFTALLQCENDQNALDFLAVFLEKYSLDLERGMSRENCFFQRDFKNTSLRKERKLLQDERTYCQFLQNIVEGKWQNSIQILNTAFKTMEPPSIVLKIALLFLKKHSQDPNHQTLKNEINDFLNLPEAHQCPELILLKASDNTIDAYLFKQYDENKLNSINKKAIHPDFLIVLVSLFKKASLEKRQGLFKINTILKFLLLTSIMQNNLDLWSDLFLFFKMEEQIWINNKQSLLFIALENSNPQFIIVFIKDYLCYVKNKLNSDDLSEADRQLLTKEIEYCKGLDAFFQGKIQEAELTFSTICKKEGIPSIIENITKEHLWSEIDSRVNFIASMNTLRQSDDSLVKEEENTSAFIEGPFPPKKPPFKNITGKIVGASHINN